MKIAIAGRPGAGKSALFDLLAHRGDADRTGASAESARAGLRSAHVEVPDVRVGELTRAFRPRRVTYARLLFQDLEQKSGPSYPALSPERRDMLSHADLVLLVVDLFNTGPDDWENEFVLQWRSILEEFILIDLSAVEARLERLEKALRIGQKPNFPGEHEVLLRMRARLESGHAARGFEMNADEERGLRSFSFLSGRPILPALNVAEEQMGQARERVAPFLEAGGGQHSAEKVESWVLFSAAVEREIQQLPSDDQLGFLEAYRLAEPAVSQVIREAYQLAGLHCFLTVGEDEVRAWAVRKGAAAAEAAGVIHSDLEKGFVRAEVLSFEEWKRFGSHAAARERGAVRLESRDYVVQDGDILNIRSGLAKSGRG